ncbi:MAG: hypothetical protein QGG40_06180, partial [Myxococcota bacterium]|nr:hypothetical protein [Myxococcota bacterium]
MKSEQGLEAIAGLSLDARLDPLTELARGLLDNGGVPSDTALSIALMMVEVLDSPVGTGRQRMEMGELLGRLGDPRLHSPDQPEYWTTVELEDGSSLGV